MPTNVRLHPILLAYLLVLLIKKTSSLISIWLMWNLECYGRDRWQDPMAGNLKLIEEIIKECGLGEEVWIDTTFQD